MTSLLPEGGVGGADLLLGLVCRGENIFFQMGIMSPGTLG